MHVHIWVWNDFVNMNKWLRKLSCARIHICYLLTSFIYLLHSWVNPNKLIKKLSFNWVFDFIRNQILIVLLRNSQYPTSIAIWKSRIFSWCFQNGTFLTKQTLRLNKSNMVKSNSLWKVTSSNRVTHNTICFLICQCLLNILIVIKWIGFRN